MDTAEALNFLKGEEKGFTQTNDALAFTARGDYQTAGGQRLTLRYNVSDGTGVNAASVNSALSPFTNRAISNDGTEKDRTHTGTAQYTHLFSPTVLNDLRFTGTYELRPRLSNSESPQVDFRTIGYFGARNFLPATQDDLRIQISDSLSLTRGAHTIKVGFDYSLVSASQVFGLNQYGGFTVVGPNVDTLLRILSVSPGRNRFDDRSVTYSRQLGNMTAAFNMTQAAVFVQDSLRLRSNLSLDFGLRWEGQFNPSPETTNTALLNTVKGFRFPNGSALDPATIPDSTRQIMPRIGFAWTPKPGSYRTVVRGHAGMFYAATPLVLMAGPTNNFRLPAGDVSITLSPTATQTVYQQLAAVGVDLNRSPLGALPVIPLETVQRASALALGATLDPFAGAALIAMPTDFRNPRSFQTGVGMESEVVRNLVIGGQFNLVNTVNLERNRDYNLPPPFVKANDASLRPSYGLQTGILRPLPSLSSITVRESSARSMFRSFTFSTQYRAKKLQLGAFYTWAQNYSDDDTERDVTGFNYADPSNFRGEYSFSRIDIRHQFTSYFVYALPLGFEVSGSLRARGGQPVNPVTGADTNEEFGTNDRPYSAPGVSLERNSFRNRKVIGNDLRVLKSFGLGETRKVQFSAEFFNLFNIDNVAFSGVNGGLFGGTYGLGIGTNGQPVPVDPRFLRLRMPDATYDRNNAQVGTPLQVQIGLRLFF
ncbi:MAG: TonB-dependent receptor [Acidobacteriia bacterium]|nr:TonB-dependent receptor [Terriglobia bacterium]